MKSFFVLEFSCEMKRNGDLVSLKEFFISESIIIKQKLREVAKYTIHRDGRYIEHSNMHSRSLIPWPFPFQRNTHFSSFFPFLFIVFQLFIRRKIIKLILLQHVYWKWGGMKNFHFPNKVMTIVFMCLTMTCCCCINDREEEIVAISGRSLYWVWHCMNFKNFKVNVKRNLTSSINNQGRNNY